MALEKFDDLKHPPVVGEHYLVRCVSGKLYDGGRGFDRFMFPVVGSWHNDVDTSINFAPFHFHFNRPFLKARHVHSLSHWGVSDIQPEHRPVTSLTMGNYSVFVTGSDEEPETRLLKMKCLRDDNDGGLNNKSFENKYEGAEVKCGSCPHRQGFNLETSQMRIVNGIMDGKRVEGRKARVCPGHFLTWDVETGKLIKRAGSVSEPEDLPIQI